MRLVKRAGGGALFAKTDAWRLPGNGRPRLVTPTPAAAMPDFAALAERFTVALPAERLAELARQLGVSAAALQTLGIGIVAGDELRALRARWEGESPSFAFLFPERDGRGRVVGLSLRAADGRKSTPMGAKRGLVIPATLRKRGEPVLICEGASDVVALETLKLPAVGRPSNAGGVDALAVLLDSQEVLVLGENDGKPSGGWPGRDGARNVARELASRRGEAVQWALPPAGAKDARSWLNAKTAAGMDPADKGACRAAGAELLAALQAAAKVEKPKRGPNAAQRLASLATDAELWHTRDGEAFATVPVSEHSEHCRIRSRAFRRWLCERAFRGGDVPNAEALQGALNVLEARAVYNGPEASAFVRVAELDGAVWLDLADDGWRAVRVDADGWEVVDNPHPKFRRPAGMRALPAPEAGGDIRELAELLHLDGETLTLCAAWLLGALCPRGPYAPLAVHGPQGAGKSVLTRTLKSLIDPAEPVARTVPRDERDLCIAAENGHVLAFDNLSGLPVWLSDALCRISTGGGLATRELYSDRDETLFNALRPTILNGIEDTASRPDLLDRCIILSLAPLPDANRRTEAELDAALDAARPRILGVLLDGVAAALRNLASVKMMENVRMADFATWVAAGEDGLGLEPGAFLELYRRNRADANTLVIEVSPVAGAVLDFIEAAGSWTGTARALLIELDGRASDAARKARGWPKTPTRLSATLRRVAPALQVCGVAIDFTRASDGRRERTITLNRAASDAHGRIRPRDASGCGATLYNTEQHAAHPPDASDALDATLHPLSESYETNPAPCDSGPDGSPDEMFDADLAAAQAALFPTPADPAAGFRG